ncbi:MAG: hypothetical protein ACLFVS_00960 [Candidatus Acetothermia bacterium]
MDVILAEGRGDQAGERTNNGPWVMVRFQGNQGERNLDIALSVRSSGKPGKRGT